MKAEMAILPLFVACATTLGAVAEDDNVLGVETSNPWPEVVTVAAGERSQAIDLSEIWMCEAFGCMAIPFSAEGWGVDGEDVRQGTRAALSVQLANGEGPEEVFARDLTGSGDVIWRNWSLEKSVYRLRHRISVDGRDDELQTLEARFSFTGLPDDAPTETEITEALVVADGADVVLVKDEGYLWRPIGGMGSGLAAASDETSRLTLAVCGEGILNLEYVMSSATLRVLVDGVANELTVADRWLPLTITVKGSGCHVVVFDATVVGAGVAKVRNLSWQGDGMMAAAESARSSVDFRQGPVLAVKRIFPFAYSSTNFTGCAGATSASTARVTVVQLTGTGDDVSGWTEEVPGFVQTLVNKKGEGTVVLKHVRGGIVLKVTHEIFEKGVLVRSESRILDLRKYAGMGLILFVG